MCVQKHYYSVPYKYCGQQSQVYVTDSEVRVYVDTALVAVHTPAGPEARGKYATTPEHMPAGHRAYQDWNAGKFLVWGSNIGPNTREVVRLIISSYEVEEQSYKTLFALLHLPNGKTCSKADLEKACGVVLKETNRPSFRRVEQAVKQLAKKEPAPRKTNSHAMVRGKDYYGGKQEESDK